MVSLYFWTTCYRKSFNPQKNFTFPNNLDLISLNAWISPHFDFKNLLKIFPQNLHTKKQINLSKINVYSVESLNRLLTQFKNAGSLISLQINLEVILHQDNLRDLLDSLTDPLVFPSNITITLKIYIFFKDYFTLQAKETVFLQRIFRKFKLDVILKLPTEYQHRWCLDSNLYVVKYIPLMINHFQQPIQDPNLNFPSELMPDDFSEIFSTSF